MSDHSSESEADEPLIQPKSILKTTKSKLIKQASFELRNLPSADNKENKNDDDQILGIREKGNEAGEMEGVRKLLYLKMPDHSSESEADEPIIEPKSILKIAKNKLVKQASFELRNLPIADNKESKNDEEQILRILEKGDEAGEVEDEPVDEPIVEALDVVHLNRNSTFNRSQQRKNTDILDSAEVKDLSWTQRCLESGSSPEATCRERKMSVVHIAAYFGENAILSEVLRVRPDLFNRADAEGRTALHYAAWEANLECVAVLLGLPSGAFTPAKAANKKATVETKITPDKAEYLCSTSGCSVEEYKELCDSTHSCSSVSKILNDVWSRCSPLHVACARLQRECVLALLACGADITVRDDKGRTPLDVCGLAAPEAGTMTGTKSRHFWKIIEGVIRYGKSRNIERDLWLSNQNGTTPLHMAVLLDSKRATKLLLDIGANPGLIDDDGQTPLHLSVSEGKADILAILANSPMYKAQKHIDKLNRDQYTPLQLAILKKWIEGVHILLEAKASIDIQANSDLNSALHLAAQVGSLDITEKLILKMGSKKAKLIDCKNAARETPLFVAIENGNASVMRCLIHEGASSDEVLGGYTVLHKAIYTDNEDVLTSLLQVEKTENLLNLTDETEKMTPLHKAALRNKPEYIRKLVWKGAKLDIQTSDGHTPLHIAAMEGNSDAIKAIFSFDKEQLLTKIKDNKQWLPFYEAAYHCRRESIDLFIDNGSNFSEVVPLESGKNSLVISIIMQSMPRSAEYLNNVFDNHMIQNEYSLDHPECEVKFDYSIMIPEDNMSQMKAISALFGYKSNFEMQKLILHPFIESFLYLKWSILRWFFFMILGIYAVFVILLTDISINIYSEDYKTAFAPGFMHVKECLLLVFICLILCLEILFLRIRGWKYFYRVENWVKIISVITAFLVLANDFGNFEHSASRLVCAIALLFSWMEITMLLSRFPEFGYYFQMFSTVALRVIKVLALFGSFLIIGFSLIFWILTDNNKSFLSPWESLIKTVVMMTSEFDYSSIVETDEEEPSKQKSPVVLQLFFIVFLICVPIVLMNLLLALAVSDVKDLETEGKIQRLSEQVEFLGNLEVLAFKLLHNKLALNKTWRVETEIVIYPGKPNWDPVNKLPRNIIESVCENLNGRKQVDEKEQLLRELLVRLDDNQNFLLKQENLNHKRHVELLNIVNQLSADVHDLNTADKAKSRWKQLFQL